MTWIWIIAHPLTNHVIQIIQALVSLFVNYAQQNPLSVATEAVLRIMYKII